MDRKIIAFSKVGVLVMCKRHTWVITVLPFVVTALCSGHHSELNTHRPCLLSAQSTSLWSLNFASLTLLGVIRKNALLALNPTRNKWSLLTHSALVQGPLLCTRAA